MSAYEGSYAKVMKGMITVRQHCETHDARLSYRFVKPAQKIRYKI